MEVDGYGGRRVISGEAPQDGNHSALASKTARINYDRPRALQRSQLSEFVFGELGVGSGSAAHNVDAFDGLRLQASRYLGRKIGACELGRKFGKNASHINCDITVADDD